MAITYHSDKDTQKANYPMLRFFKYSHMHHLSLKKCFGKVDAILNY